MRSGKGRIGGVTTFKTRLPVARVILPGVAAARIAIAGNGAQNAIRFHEVCESQRLVRGNVHRQQPEKGMAGGEREGARTRGIRCEIVLSGRPRHLAGKAIQLRGRFHRANPAGVGIGPENLPRAIQAVHPEATARRRDDHRTGGQKPKQILNAFHFRPIGIEIRQIMGGLRCKSSVIIDRPFPAN